MNRDIDIFALHAMQVVILKNNSHGAIDYPFSEIAADSYRLARAMMRESKEYEEKKTP